MIRDFGIVWTRTLRCCLNGLANTAMLSVLAAIARAAAGLHADAGADVAQARRCARRRVHSSTACAASRSCCSPTSSITAFLRSAQPRTTGAPAWSALTIYNAAYMAEILRGAWAAMPREPIEAGVALRLFRPAPVSPHHPAARWCCRPGRCIGNQLIQIIKDSAFLTIIALPELTHAASSIQSRHYVPFAAFITAVAALLGALPGRSRRA